MANIQVLPNTCSAHYISNVSEMDQIKEVVSRRIREDVKDENGGRVCALLSCVTREPVRKSLRAAGFKQIGFYISHRHNGRKVYIMLRQTSAKEFAEKKAYFPLKKGEKK